MNDKENVNYTITWTQPLAGWKPLRVSEVVEPEITDFTEARAVLAKFMSKFDNK